MNGLRFEISDELRRSFLFILFVCKALFAKENGRVSATVSLTDWNNDNGVEFDALQRVFPCMIPLSDSDNLPANPVVLIEKLPELVLFVVTAIQVDASFSVASCRDDANLFCKDGELEIECAPHMIDSITDWLRV